jgi:uncharacterized protein DUF6600
MKTDIFWKTKLTARICVLALLAEGLANAAQSESPKDGAAAATASAVPAVVETNMVSDPQAEHKIIQTVPPAKPPAEVKTSPALAEVIRLVQAGVSEEVILAYVSNSTNVFQLSSAEILYLNDLGVSSNIITAMMRMGGAPTNAPPAVIAQKSPDMNVLPAPPPQLAAPVAPTMIEAPPPAPEAASYVTTTTPYYPVPEPQPVTYFYDSLAPYGSWVEIAGYGWCWQPTVAVVDYSWRPYCDRGHWIYSNCGWYWLSDYSWGWAPFHYGRWHHHPHAGWVWAPGATWGPAWVSWRYTSGYCGWAPLPPEAHYVAGFGFSYYGSRVGVSFDFGLHPEHYAFVPTHSFLDHHLSRHTVSSTHVKTVYRDSSVMNNYIVGNNNTIINEGVGTRRVSAATRTEIRPAVIREHTVGRTTKAELLEKEGLQSVVYRPPLPKQSPRTTEILSQLGRSAEQDRLRVASRSTVTGFARTDLEKSSTSVAPPPAPARTPKFFPEPARDSVTPAGRANSDSRMDARSSFTPAAPAPNAAPATGSTTETQRRSPNFFVRRPGELNNTPPTGATAPQPRSTETSPRVIRIAPDSPPVSRNMVPVPTANNASSGERVQQPVVVPPQSRAESVPAPRLNPNYSQPFVSPAPAYQTPAQRPATAVSPSVAPQPRSESRAPSYAPSPAPSRSASPPAAQPAPSRSSRSESAPSSSQSSRSDRGRN